MRTETLAHTMDVILLDTPRSALRLTRATGITLLVASDNATDSARAWQYDSAETESKPKSIASLRSSLS